MRISKKKNTNLNRRTAQRESYDLVLIVCEGQETEPNYLESLREHEDLSSVNVVITGESHSDPMSVVNHAIKIYEERANEKNPSTLFDKVYCLIDRDEHAKFDAAVHKANTYTYKAKRNILTIVRSYPCFEYWYLCHFKYSRAGIHKIGSKTAGDACISLLNPLWQTIFGTKYTKNQSNVYPKLAHLIQLAITNSKRALQDTESSSDMNPSTEVHLLVEYLLNIKNSPTKK